MADWSQLQQDIHHEIQTHLNSTFYAVRLRSICSTWRHSFQSNGPNQPSSYTLPFPNSSLFPDLPISLIKHTTLLLSPPSSPISDKPDSWVIKIEEHGQLVRDLTSLTTSLGSIPRFIEPEWTDDDETDDEGPSRIQTKPDGENTGKTHKEVKKFHLYYPLSDTRINPLPNEFPRMVDMSKFGIRELGTSYVIRFADGGNYLGNAYVFGEKIAFMQAKCGDGDEFLVMTIDVAGQLALFDSFVKKWTILDNFGSCVDDVIAFNGEFYAVDAVGKTVVLVENSKVSLVAKPICGGDKKRLVEMGEDLMLVDLYIGLPPLFDDGNEDIGRFLDDFLASRSMWFRVYKLDWEEKCWVEVKDLGDNVLFLGLTSAFSASAVDLSLDRGNCIYANFLDRLFPDVEGEVNDHGFEYHCGGVYNLEDASISYSKLFWPPPSWFVSCPQKILST